MKIKYDKTKECYEIKRSSVWIFFAVVLACFVKFPIASAIALISIIGLTAVSAILCAWMQERDWEIHRRHYMNKSGKPKM